MAEVISKDGTWTFDGEVVRIVPGRDRGVHKLRQLLGEVVVPLTAVAGATYEQGRKGGRLRLRTRDGADPFTQATGSALPANADPYSLAIENDRTGVAEYMVEELRNALLIEQVPDGPVDHYLMPGPAVPLTAAGSDGTATFDGETIRIEWNWATQESKKKAGPRTLARTDLTGVDWDPGHGLENGYLRFRVTGAPTGLAPSHDPNCLTLWGFNKERGTTAILAAAVIARLPHPAAPAITSAPAETDHDALLRRLRELGDLHQKGILTDEEFAATKKALIARLT